MGLKILYRLCVGFALALSVASQSAVAMPSIATDSRIKIFVYNEYDVYQVVTHYGYQSNIEFAKGEEVETISVGDRIGWQVVPAGRRLFIRAQEESAHTNMTVITNKRTYQFDLRSDGGGELRPSEELSYVVRFYYPDENPVPVRPLAAIVAPAAAIAAPSAPASREMNYQYTYTGHDARAPLKVFDNGVATFFRLRPSSVPPKFFVVSERGKEVPVRATPVQNGYVMVGTVAKQYVVRYGDEYICVYKEG